MISTVTHRTDTSKSRQKQKRAREQRIMLQNIGVRVPSVSKKPVRPASIKILERQYLADVLELLNPMYALVRELLVPQIPKITKAFNKSIKVDAVNYASLLTRVFEQLALEIVLLSPDTKVGAVAFKNGAKVNRFNKTQIDRSVKSVLGIDIFRSEPWLATQLVAFTEMNVALIKTLPQAYFGRLQTMIRTEVEKGTSSRNITKMISEETGISRRHARLITRDQVSKFNGQLNMLRQTESGINKYTWSTSGDEKVRKTHKSHNGKVFFWSKPPKSTGHPGFDVQCRCVPIPVLDEFKETPKKKRRR